MINYYKTWIVSFLNTKLNIFYQQLCQSSRKRHCTSSPWPRFTIEFHSWKYYFWQIKSAFDIFWFLFLLGCDRNQRSPKWSNLNNTWSSTRDKNQHVWCSAGTTSVVLPCTNPLYETRHLPSLQHLSKILLQYLQIDSHITLVL